MAERLFIARHARVLQLTLNRPQARNALNNALLTQIADVLDAAALDPVGQRLRHQR